MPLYDYRCAECGREVEVMHRINDDGPEVCEACGGAMSKVLSPPTIHFKGSGWAKKDAAAATSKQAKPKASSPTASDGPAATSESKGNATSSTEKAGSGSSKTESKSSASAKAD